MTSSLLFYSEEAPAPPPLRLNVLSLPPPAHLPPSQVLWGAAPSLTCLQGGGALLAGDGPAAHRGAGAQVEPVSAQGLQVAQDPRGGVGVADIHRLRGPRFLGVVD